MKTVVHVTLEKAEVETVLKALVERRTGHPVQDCWEEIVVGANKTPVLKKYHFQCGYGKAEETKKKKIQKDSEMHPMHTEQVEGEQQGAVQSKRRGQD
jgi:hypothetical protein